MLTFLLDNLIWVILASSSFTGLLWTIKRDGVLALSAQAAIIQISREGGTYLDVRSVDEFASGHIPRSRHIPADQIITQISSVERLSKKPIVVICAKGLAGKAVVKKLRAKGIEKVYYLAGGMALWKNEQLPLTKK